MLLIYLFFAMGKKNSGFIQTADRPNLYDYLKILALITMIIDHCGYYLYPEYTRLRLVGRIAFPIFLFLVGFSGSYRWRRDISLSGFFLRIVALIVLYYFGQGSYIANILIGITLSRILLYYLDTYKEKKELFFFIFFYLFILHPLLFQILDYGSFPFFFALRGWIAKNYKQYFHFGIFILILLLFQNIFVFHFGFQEETRFYPRILVLFYFILYFLFYTIKEKNISLRITPIFDNIVLFFSKHTLFMYVFHILLLTILSIVKFSY